LTKARLWNSRTTKGSAVFPPICRRLLETDLRLRLANALRTQYVEKGDLMNNSGTVHIDNRDPSQMYEYLEARIDVLKRRISELEEENQVLRIHYMQGSDTSNAALTFEKVGFQYQSTARP
jgi:hypothetical protein